MDGELTPSYDISIVGSTPLDQHISRKRSLGDAFDITSDALSEDIMTPPNSTLRKNLNKCPQPIQENNLHPLSPVHSSPIAPTRTKKQKSEGCPRSNGNLSVDEILRSLENRKLNNELEKKPPYSYAILICLAILQSPEGKLTLSQIYNWIATHFTFYKPKDASWQNSIRHNLSLNEAFIKTEKSSDGKGHFWEVKPLSAPKFFKGELGGYDEIRKRLSDIEHYFSSRNISSYSDDNPDSDIEDSSKENSEDEDYSNQEAGQLPTIQFSTENSNNNRALRFPFTQSLNYNELESSEENILEPPCIMKRTHTTIGLQSIPESNREFYPMHDITNTLHQSNSMLIKSPQNIKRYICSFNSSFDEMSPRTSRNESGPGPLLDPVIQNPHVLPLPQSQASYQHDLLKTPEIRRSQSLERTPAKSSNTPKDNEILLKKWQTPSHLFEDIYSSPIFKAMNSGSKVTSTPGGTIFKSFSPRKLSEPELSASGVKSKLSSGGLFGVDIYSVWKRATEQSNENEESGKQDLPQK